MGLVLLLVVLAILFGGLGLLIEGLFWLVVIGAILLVASAIAGFMGRGART